MIEIPEKTYERAILAALNTSTGYPGNKVFGREMVEEHLAELEELALTAGAETIIKLIQERPSTDPAYYVGKGKAEELAALAEQNAIDLIIFDDDLTPVQVRNLERMIDKKIIDRSGLILDIFASRAKTNEAKTQVELAQLEYMLPRLTRAWTHLSKQYGGIGTKGPGETQIETDRRIIRNRISHLKEKLKRIERQRETQSQQRKELIKITLVGYTNAGKSTLFNLLTNADVFAENKLFATLDSTTRILEYGRKEKLLISDTVGFIRKLPPNLVASFKSTLNEVREADVIIHIIDITHQHFEEQISVVEQTLKDLNSDKKTRIKLFNKVDALTDKNRISYVKNKYPDSILVSALRGINISQLMNRLTEIIESSYVEEKINLKLNEAKKAARIHSLAEVLSTEYKDETIHITYRTNRENADKIKKLISES